MQDRMLMVFSKVYDYKVIKAVRYSMVTLIPLIMAGSIALALTSFPWAAYQGFIREFGGGFVYTIFHAVYEATFGMLSIYTAALVGYYYGLESERHGRQYGYAAMVVSLVSFFLLSGVPAGGFDVFGSKGVFTAIIAACLSSAVLTWISDKMQSKTLLTDGADVRLGFSIQLIFPSAITIISLATVNYLVFRLFDVSSVYELLLKIFDAGIFSMGGDVLRGLVFVFSSSILWFFGIHGSNMLEGAVSDLFVRNTDINLELVAQGNAPTEIITKPFLDCFVLMGGCGTTICLLGALLMFSKRSSTHQLAKIASFPMLFNINELMVFGLPIIYNGVFLIPFLCTPIVCFLTAYASMKLGLVPLVSHGVEWTTPIIFGGYIATGSVSGSILQIVNLAIGIAIYAPFVKKYDKLKARTATEDYNKLVEKMKESERLRIPVSLSYTSASYGWMGKALTADLKHSLNRNELKLYYQPQFHADGRCIGAEALLRWKHHMLGIIYPPLVFQLAEEAGFLEKLERWVIEQAVTDIKYLRDKYADRNLKISANVTGTTIQADSFEKFLKGISEEYPVNEMRICIEVTEQAALTLDDDLGSRFSRIREMGYLLAVDDFSMGSTSIQYLTGDYFDLIKLDGSLVKGILDNSRSCEIISSVIHLAESLKLDVLAEYVSEAAIQKKLLELGCELYQGWYYSPAITLEAFDEMLGREGREGSSS